MKTKEKFEIGSRFVYDGEVCELIGMEGPTLTFRTGTSRAVAKTSEVVDSEDFKVLHADGGDDEDNACTDPLASIDRRVLLENVPKPARKQAEAMERHICEMVTGYASGDPAIPGEKEPLSDYDPAHTTLTHRVNAKAGQLGCTPRQLWSKLDAYERDGLLGLVDKRKVKLISPLVNIDEKVVTATVAVLDKLARETKVSKTEKRRQINEHLKKEYGEGTVTLPPDSTMNRVLDELQKGRGFHLSAKRMQSIANAPATPHRNFSRLARRPGEYVLLDSTPLDVFGCNPRDFKWVRVTLTIAIDLFTRSILAWRLTPYDPKGVDAALLLADVIKPKPWSAGWSPKARWRYHGVPENFVVPIWPNVPEPAGIPVVAPETVVIDHGKVFVSRTFTDACRHLQTNVQRARPVTPTDKAVVERFFDTIRKQLLEKLPGYKGPDVWSRGPDVEAGAFYFLNELYDIVGEYLATCYQVRHHDGLEIAGAERLHLSPNDAFDLGLVTAGFLYVPPSPTIYFELLATEWRTIQDYGVQLFNLRYDGEGLEDGIDPKDRYRNAHSPFKGVHRGKWPIRYDPRDLSKVYFQRLDGSWHTLKWKGDVGVEQPFADIHVGYAKELVRERGGNPSNHDEMAQALNDLIGRLEQKQIDKKKERELYVKAFARTEAARRDQSDVAFLHSVPEALRALDEVEDDESITLDEADPFDDIPLFETYEDDPEDHAVPDDGYEDPDDEAIGA